VLLAVLPWLITSPQAMALAPDKAIGQYLLAHWDNRDGLPQNSVTSIAQGPLGYLWLGTLEGLVRFDGARFTLFNSRNQPAFRHNFILGLTADSRNNLWIATSGGGLLRYADGVFQRFDTATGVPDDQVVLTYEDSRGRIWLGTDGGGVAQITATGDVSTDSRLAAIGNHIRAVVENESGLWIGSERGLFLLTDNAELQHFSTSEGLPDQSVRALAAGAEGALWIGTDLGVARLRDNRVNVPAALAPLAREPVISLLRDDAGSLWLGTEGSGVWRLGESGLESFSAQQGLSDDSVSALFEDREKNLWVGTNLGGLHRLADGVATTWGLAEGLPSNTIRSVLEDSSGALWIGSEGAGVTRWHNGDMMDFQLEDGLPGLSVHAALEDRAGRLWLGTDHGVALFDGSRFRVPAGTADLGNTVVLAVLQTRDGALWLGTYDEGLYRLWNGRLEHYGLAEGLSYNTVNVLLEDGAGDLWIGTRGGGLNRFRDGHFTQYGTSQGLPDDLVFSLLEADDGGLWVGTYGGGLARFTDGRFSTVDESHGLFDNVIHRIVDDGRGRYWMSSNRGIFSVPIAALEAVAAGRQPSVDSQVYGIADGMQNPEGNGGANAGLRDHRGHLWFATMGGLVRIEPGMLPGHGEFAGPLLIEAISVDGQPVAAEDGLVLDAGSRNIEIGYTGSFLRRPDLLQFRYRLRGLDDDWIEVGDRRLAVYPNLPAGNYRFEVAARAADGAWIAGQQSLRFRVLPRYVETTWFRLALLGTLMIVGWLLHRLRLRQLMRRTVRLEAVVAQRTADLREANDRLQLLANQDGLTGVLNRRAFDALLQEECRRAQRSGSPLSLLLVDIDHFKLYNDRYGHQTGDRAICQVTEVLQQACGRAGEIVARYGGEELAVILPAASHDGALSHAESMRRAVLALQLAHPDSPSHEHLTISVGVACSAVTEQGTPAALLRAADQALYDAKASGRNRVEGWRPSQVYA
jgi:diguanylate cyclase (GGDEF)-like protein